MIVPKVAQRVSFISKAINMCMHLYDMLKRHSTAHTYWSGYIITVYVCILNVILVLHVKKKK